jgi:hypothetical protein
MSRANVNEENREVEQREKLNGSEHETNDACKHETFKQFEISLIWSVGAVTSVNEVQVTDTQLGNERQNTLSDTAADHNEIRDAIKVIWSSLSIGTEAADRANEEERRR